MKEDYLASISALEQEYNRYRKQADRMRESNHGLPSEEEAQLRLKAGEAAKSIAQMTDGAVREKYEKGKNRQKEMVKEILASLDKAAAGSAGGKYVAAGNPSSGTGKALEAAGEVDPAWYRERPKHGFDHVSGMDRVKGRLTKNVARMKRKELLQYLNMNTLNGFLFYGPPGCGKTFLTEAFVHELMGDNYKYLALNGKDIHSKYSGEAEKNVSAVFAEAKNAAPAILFFDEMDAVCTERQQPELPQHTKALTDAFLTEFNILKNSGAQVYLIGATNYPQNLDTAMISRMELIKIPLPDQAARASYFSRNFADAKLQLAGDISPEDMAAKTGGYSYRDMEKITNYIKGEIFDSMDNLDVDEAIRRIEDGQVKVTRKLFEDAFRAVLPTYDKKYMDALAAWEVDHGIEPEEPEDSQTQGKFEAEGDAAASDNGEEPPSLGAEGKIFPDWTYQFAPGMNNHPCLDTQYAFYFSKNNYSEGSVHFKESAKRFLENAEGFEKEIERLTGTEKMTTGEAEILRERQRQLQEAAGKAFKDQGNIQLFQGYDKKKFIPAYDLFYTGPQGAARPDFQGTCGIIASCNVANQQLGSMLTEADGIRMFTEEKKCVVSKAPNNGGTAGEGWKAVLEKRCGLEVIVAYQDLLTFQTKVSIAHQPAGLLAMVLSGYSVIVSAKAKDLSQRELSKRYRYEKKSFLHNAGELKAFSGENHADHALTLAGFSIDGDGNVLGLWLNDTGGWTSSNRVFVDTEKWMEMMRSTFGIQIAFVRKPM